MCNSFMRSIDLILRFLKGFVKADGLYSNLLHSLSYFIKINKSTLMNT
jgi:hypothetical protein